MLADPGGEQEQALVFDALLGPIQYVVRALRSCTIEYRALRPLPSSPSNNPLKAPKGDR